MNVIVIFFVFMLIEKNSISSESSQTTGDWLAEYENSSKRKKESIL